MAVGTPQVDRDKGVSSRGPHGAWQGNHFLPVAAAWAGRKGRERRQPGRLSPQARWGLDTDWGSRVRLLLRGVKCTLEGAGATWAGPAVDWTRGW